MRGKRSDELPTCALRTRHRGRALDAIHGCRRCRKKCLHGGRIGSDTAAIKMPRIPIERDAPEIEHDVLAAPQGRRKQASRRHRPSCRPHNGSQRASRSAAILSSMGGWDMNRLLEARDVAARDAERLHRLRQHRCRHVDGQAPAERRSSYRGLRAGHRPHRPGTHAASRTTSRSCSQRYRARSAPRDW